MAPEIGVFDAGPIISFHQVQRISLLNDLFVQTVVPPPVAREAAPSLGILPVWMELRNVHPAPISASGLGLGEREAITLATKLAADFIVLDDRRARKVAEELGLTLIGSLGLLVEAKRRELIGEVRPLMDAMISHGLYASEGLYRRILSIAGEAV